MTARKATKRVLSPQTKMVSLSIDTGTGKIVKTGDVDNPAGDITLARGNRIIFEYADEPQTFALFVVSGPNAGNKTPFDEAIYSTERGLLALNVKRLARQGSYQYRLVLVDDAGDLKTEDPQIIIN